MASKVLEIEFRAKDATSASLKQMGLNADQTARKLKEINNAGSGGSGGGKGKGKGEDGGLIKQLKTATGEESTLGNVAKIATGAGAVAGLTLVGRALGDATAKAVELRNEFKAGTVSATGIAVELGKSLPIIGGFVTAGQNIRELFTGEQAAIDKLNKESEAQGRIIEWQNGLYEQQKKRVQAVGDALKEIANRRANVGLEGFALARNQQTQGAQKRLDDIDRQRQDQIDASRKETRKRLDEISDQARKGELDAGLAGKLRNAAISDGKKNEADINAQFGKQRAAEQQASAAEEREMVRKSLEDGEKDRRHHELEINSIIAKSRQDRLRTLGLAGAAELDAIKENAEAQKQAVKEKYDELIKQANPAFRASLEGQRNREMAAIDQSAGAAAGDLRYTRQYDANTRLRSQRQELLDFGVSSASSPAEELKAKREAERYRLQTEMRDREKALRETLNDPTLTQQQKQIAQQQMQQWVGTLGQQFDLSTMGKPEIVQHLADLNESMTLTGVSAAARERDTGDEPLNRLVGTSEESKKLQADFNAMFKQFFQQWQQQTQGGTSSAVF